MEKDLKDACLKVLDEYNIRHKFYKLLYDIAVQDVNYNDDELIYKKFKDIARVVKENNLC